MASATSDALSNVAASAKEKVSGLKGIFFCFKGIESNEVRPEDITNVDSQLANEPAYQAGKNLESVGARSYL
uniref:Uncharacterized protein n=1 Tax=Panagrolaimus davidi TaxID=227884 RepID=A0A914QWB3_9BILA